MLLEPNLEPDLVLFRLWSQDEENQNGAKSACVLGFGRLAPVAQLDRAPDYESGGQGFESSPVRHCFSSHSGRSRREERH